ncbi:MAG: hypothetical protein KDA32_06665 [Phycisphaerales bacterium]|nr:hypothetical protein [Phycisphaerales bacterium]
MRLRLGLTLIEVIVSTSVTSLLAVFMMCGVDNARRDAAKAIAMDNMKFHGEFAHMNAQESSDALLHQQHANTHEELDRASQTTNDQNAYAMGAGDWDWGGKDGLRVDDQLDFTPTGPRDRQHRGASGRFMNRFVETTGSRAGFEIFNDPADTGLDSEVRSAPAPWTPGDLIKRSVHATTGNSYMGDFYYFKDHAWYEIDGGIYRRFGAYRRSLPAFPEADRALLFWESRFIQALANTAEINVGIVAGNYDTPPGKDPRDVVGWHGGVGEFLATFADGHTAMIECRQSGSLINPADFRDGQTWFWRLHWRSPQWRYDNFPAPMVIRSWFSPILRYSGKWLTGSTARP